MIRRVSWRRYRELTTPNTETKSAGTPSYRDETPLTTRFGSTVATSEIQLSHGFEPSSTLRYEVRLESLPGHSDATRVATKASEENRSSTTSAPDLPGPSTTANTSPNGEIHLFDDVLTELFPVEPAYDAPLNPSWNNYGNGSQQSAVSGIAKGIALIAHKKSLTNRQAKLPRSK